MASRISNRVKRKIKVEQVPIKKVQVSESHRSDLGNIEDLALSIKTSGLINPIILDADYNLISGLRRLRATEYLGAENIDVQFYENLDSFGKIKVKIEEQLGKKDLAWPEEVLLKRQLHELYVAAKKRGSKWTQKRTAKILGMPSTTLSEEIRLAYILDEYPELKKKPSKREAIKNMYRVREIEALRESGKRELKKSKQGQGSLEIKTVEQLQAEADEEKKREEEAAREAAAAAIVEEKPPEDEGVDEEVETETDASSAQLQSILDSMGEVEEEEDGEGEDEPEKSVTSTDSLDDSHVGEDAGDDSGVVEESGEGNGTAEETADEEDDEDKPTTLVLPETVTQEQVYSATPASGATTTFINADCFAVMENIPDNSIDLIVTDPP